MLPLSIFILGACNIFCVCVIGVRSESLLYIYIYMIKVVICEWQFCEELFGSS